MSALREQRAVGAGVVRVGASIIACSLAIGRGRPATISGVAIFVCISPSGHVADAQVGEIPGFARQPPPRSPRRALLTQRTHAPKRVPLQASESHSVACPTPLLRS